jgi:hypothetical protein
MQTKIYTPGQNASLIQLFKAIILSFIEGQNLLKIFY